MFSKSSSRAMVLMSAVLLWIAALAGPRLVAAAVPGQMNTPARSYRFYNPKVTWHVIYEGKYGPGCYAYNHCASLAWFDGHFCVVWNGNQDTHLEPFPNRQVLLSRSADFIHWSPPQHFVGPGAVNPCHAHPKERQAQPNLVNYMEKELWCTWLYGSVDRDRSGIYLSRLGKGPNAHWVNKRIFHRRPIAGQSYGAWAAQTPFVCSSGRVLAPLMLVRREPDRPQTFGYNMCYYTDDDGETWNASSAISKVDEDVAQWEPLFYEQADGKLRAFMRNFTGANVPSTEWLLTCTGTGSGKGEPVVFEADPKFSRMETISCRTQVFRMQSGRYCMLKHDLYAVDRGYHSRLGIAVHFSRSGADDFVAGPRVSQHNMVSAYPVGIEHDGKIYVVYTTGPGWEPRSIEGAIVDPAPDPDQYYIWSRAKDRPTFVRKEIEKDGKKHGRWLERTNPEYKPTAPRLLKKDGRQALFFRACASAGVDIDPVAFEAGELLTVTFEAKALKLQKYGSLVFCSFGDRIPIRIGMPANRPGQLYAYGRDEWRPAGDFTLGQWHKITVTVRKDTFSVSIGDKKPESFANPIVSPTPRLYLGDGYEVDTIRSNRGSEFVIDVDSLVTRVDS